ncbi:glycosyltransferase family 4 protein [Lacibacter sp.]|uniref:glycosyltransferase family 4 protein n=1 Tax=Lacibacter sp. TaxID=1915409 RepID=UPI002B4AB161|nr:glycosyltransferase family 4 protein [Lacibacter sp.]HLP36096.1 glycosyltransferase family 4 protein [Lacibacter sp.]
MFLPKQNRKDALPVILHFVTWYPSKANEVEGIFTRRHIDAFAENDSFTHIVVRKTEQEVSVYTYLKCLLGFFPTEVYKNRRIVVFPVKSILFRRFFWRFSHVFKAQMLRSLCYKLNPSLLHLHVVYGFAEEAMFLNDQYHLPFIVSEHMAPFPFDWLWDKEMQVVRPMRSASAVIAVSKAQAEQIREYTGIHPAIIPNVVEAAEFFYTPFEKQVSGLEIVLVGIYDSRKGADYVISVFSDFIQQYPGARLHFAGEATTERMTELERQIEEAGLQNQVIFHGKLTPGELCRLYQQCDFYVCASVWESFGLTMLEALFTGLPVLSTDCGGVLDFITEKNGLLISNDRRKETLLEGLLQMPDRLAYFDRAAIAAAAKEQFAKEKIKEQYNAVYHRVLSSAQTTTIK